MKNTMRGEADRDCCRSRKAAILAVSIRLSIPRRSSTAVPAMRKWKDCGAKSMVERIPNIVQEQSIVRMQC